MFLLKLSKSLRRRKNDKITEASNFKKIPIQLLKSTQL